MIEMYSPTVLEIRNQGVMRAMLPLKALRKNPSMPLPSSGGPEHSWVCICNTLISGSILTGSLPVCLCVLLSSYKEARHGI